MRLSEGRRPKNRVTLTFNICANRLLSYFGHLLSVSITNIGNIRSIRASYAPPTVACLISKSSDVEYFVC